MNADYCRCVPVAAYSAGIVGIFHSNWLINIAAMFLLAHAMTIAAYMIHECGHNLVFKSIRHNASLGRFLSWLCGSAYGTYEDMRYKHFRHHVDVDDVVWFDYEKFFEDHPQVLRITQALEWFYIPAHDLIMHFIMVFTSFIIPQRRNQRRRNVIVIVIRASIFVTAAVLFPMAALLYSIACMMMLTIRTVHVYKSYPTLPVSFRAAIVTVDGVVRRLQNIITI